MDNLISVIIPCYNQAKYLSFAVKSVLAQTINNWECIIVNDGSKDDSFKIAKQLAELDSRIIVVNQDNTGLSGARNAGINIANGEFILPLDADDAISDNYLEACFNTFIKNSNTVLVYGKAEKFGNINAEWLLPPYDYKDLLFSNMIYCTAMYKKQSWVEAGGYDSKMIYGFEDWEFWLNMLNEFSIVICNKDITFYYRIKEQSMYDSMSNKHIELMRRNIYLKHHEKYNHLFIDPIAVFHEKEITEMKFQRLLSRPDWYLKQLVKKFLQ